MKKLTLLSAAIAMSLSGAAMADHANEDSRYSQNSRYSQSQYNDSQYNSRYSYQNENVRYGKAKVVKVKPIYDYRQMRYSEPTQRCWTEPRHSSRNRAGSVIGGIIGGVIGNKIGNKIGSKVGHRRGHRALGTVAGAVIGSSIGKDVASNKHSRRVCETVEQTRYDDARARISGYDVTYKYKGKRYHTVMDYDPGRWLPIEISVRPRGR